MTRLTSPPDARDIAIAVAIKSFRKIVWLYEDAKELNVEEMALAAKLALKKLEEL